MKVAHLTTVDLSLRYLVFPQLLAIVEAGGESVGISSPGPWVPELESAGIRHVPLASSTRGMNVVADLRAALELWRVLKRERFDILHTHNPKPGLYGRVLGRLAGVPIVVNTVHGLYATPDDPWWKRALVYGLEAVASRFSDAELVQSQEDLALLHRLHLSPGRRLRHLGNGVDLARFDPARFAADDRATVRAELGVTDDQILIGGVGRLVAEKGFPELLEAVVSLDDRYVLVCAGPDDPDKADALPRDLIERAASDGVQFLGMRTDVDRLYAAMDIFVLASHREGFPRAAMEAAAMALPIVATDIRGCREVVEEGVTGLLVPVRDPAALREAIVRLGDDEDLRREFGRQARARAEERFDERKVVEIVMDTYRELARKKGLGWLGSGGEVTFRPATEEDVPALARMHSTAIDTGFLPTLGSRFMRRLYEALVSDPAAVVIVTDDAGAAVGFVAGVTDTGQFYRRFVRRHGVAAGLAALPRLIRPSVLRRAWETLRYEGTDGDVPAELLSMAVDDAYRGRGIGYRLGVGFLEAMRDAGPVKVVVGPENEAAIGAYRKMGFADATTIEVHAGERSKVMVWRP
jgi:glycosyltransferase involved in cell wall biosynthesis/ribosomal protein S18 acetylase RimI-like enzyme